MYNFVQPGLLGPAAQLVVHLTEIQFFVGLSPNPFM